MPIFLLPEEKPWGKPDEKIVFPPPHLSRKDGLLAVGGDLSKRRLLLAYAMGIFPWFSEGEPIMWWSPDPRLVLYPRELKLSKSLVKTIKKGMFKITVDSAFKQVINSCAQVRLQNNQLYNRRFYKNRGTWIVDDMIKAYIDLHESGFAHSVEAWYKEELAGGLYGVSLGRCFFGESMFIYKSNASKVAFVALAQHLKALSFDMIDCQQTTEHLIRFGAREISRNSFLKQLEMSLKFPTIRGKWSF